MRTGSAGRDSAAWFLALRPVMSLGAPPTLERSRVSLRGVLTSPDLSTRLLTRPILLYVYKETLMGNAKVDVVWQLLTCQGEVNGQQ